jgi:hypothetical protein
MKQLTIICSSDLSGLVQETLIQAGAEGFLNIAGATGVMPGAAAPHGRPPRWRADLFIIPAEDDIVARVVGALREHAGRCATEPCLKILVAPLEEVH